MEEENEFAELVNKIADHYDIAPDDLMRLYTEKHYGRKLSDEDNEEYSRIFDDMPFSVKKIIELNNDGFKSVYGAKKAGRFKTSSTRDYRDMNSVDAADIAAILNGDFDSIYLKSDTFDDAYDIAPRSQVYPKDFLSVLMPKYGY